MKSLGSLLIFVFVFGTTQVGAANSDDKRWIMEQMSKVLITYNSNRTAEIKAILQNELDLVTKGEQEVALNFIATKCKEAEAKQKTGKVDGETTRTLEECRVASALTRDNRLPVDLAYKVFDSLKELQSRGLVIVDRTVSLPRTGVMPKEAFEQLTLGKGSIIVYAVAQPDSEYLHKGEKYMLQPMLAEGASYLDFALKYDFAKRTFENKYAADSVENMLVTTAWEMLNRAEHTRPEFNAAKFFESLADNWDFIVASASEKLPNTQEALKEVQSEVDYTIDLVD